MLVFGIHADIDLIFFHTLNILERNFRATFQDTFSVTK